MLRVFKVTSPMSVGSWILARLGRRDEHRGRARALGAPEAASSGSPSSCRSRAARRSRPTPARCSRTPRSPCGARRATSCRWLFGASAARERRRGGDDLHADRATQARRGEPRSAASRSSSALVQRDGAAARLRRRGLQPGRGRQVRRALEGAAPPPARALLAWRGKRSRAAAVAGGALVLAGRWRVALVGVQGRLPVGARPALHRRPAEGTTRGEAMTLTGILLVGGASTRFGSPKALARVGDETFAGRAWRLLGETCEHRLAVGKASDGLDLPLRDSRRRYRRAGAPGRARRRARGRADRPLRGDPGRLPLAHARLGVLARPGLRGKRRRGTAVGPTSRRVPALVAARAHDAARSGPAEAALTRWPGSASRRWSFRRRSS